MQSKSPITPRKAQAHLLRLRRPPHLIVFFFRRLAGVLSGALSGGHGRPMEPNRTPRHRHAGPTHPPPPPFLLHHRSKKASSLCSPLTPPLLFCRKTSSFRVVRCTLLAAAQSSLPSPRPWKLPDSVVPLWSGWALFWLGSSLCELASVGVMDVWGFFFFFFFAGCEGARPARAGCGAVPSEVLWGGEAESHLERVCGCRAGWWAIHGGGGV